MFFIRRLSDQDEESMKNDKRQGVKLMGGWKGRRLDGEESRGS